MTEREVWHVISGDGFLEALRRVAKGEDPDLVYLELFANAERPDDDGWIHVEADLPGW